MTIKAQYLGMPLDISELDAENLQYFGYCAEHDFRLQACGRCGLLRYPPTTACPWCAEAAARWVGSKAAAPCIPMSRSTTFSRRSDHVPYLVLLVDLDTQKGVPTEDEALRIVGIRQRRMECSRRPRSCARSASAPAYAWRSPMSLPGLLCRNGLSMRPHRSPRLFGGIRKNDADRRPASPRRRRFRMQGGSFSEQGRRVLRAQGPRCGELHRCPAAATIMASTSVRT
jgi:hypothetical protein